MNQINTIQITELLDDLNLIATQKNMDAVAKWFFENFGNARSQERGTKAQATNKNMVKCLCGKCSAYSHCNRDEKDKWYCNWYFKQETKA